MKESLDKLHLWEENPRDISKEDFTKLKNTLLEYPELHEANPILALKDGEIFSGNQRYKALQELGIKEYPVKYYDCDRKRAIEMAIVENSHAGTWLHDELLEMANEFDIDLEQFNIDADIQKAIDKLEPEVVEDTVPDVKKDPETVLGDLWQLGNHRLLAGDATKIDDVERLMDGEKADLVFTDPPYGMDLDTGYSKMPSTKKEGKKSYSKVIGDDEEFDPSFILSIFDYCDEIVMFGADYYADKLPKGGSWYVWDKRVEEKFDRMIGSAFELVWSKTKHKREIARFNNTLFSGEKDAKNKVHPTQKPLKMLAWFLDRLKGNLVVDLYGGSGSCLIACEQLNRKCYMMELDPQYVRVIIDRWEKLTGEKAVLLS